MIMQGEVWGCMGYQDPATLRRLYHDEGMSTYDIADRFAVSADTVCYHMNKHDIDTRKPPYERHPSARIDTDGYLRVEHRDGESRKTLRIHRLVAVAEHGFDVVAGNDIHHKNGVPWDNRPSNLEVVDESKHRAEHNRRRNMKRNDDGTFDRLESIDGGDESSSANASQGKGD